MTDRYNQGWEQSKAIDGRQCENVVNSLAAIAPDVSKYIIEFVFGEIYMREDSDLKKKGAYNIRMFDKSWRLFPPA